MSITQAVTNYKGRSSSCSHLNVHYVTNRKSLFKSPTWVLKQKKVLVDDETAGVCEHMHSFSPLLETGNRKPPNLNTRSCCV